MKKTIPFLLSVALLASCSEVIDEQNVNDTPNSINIVFADAAAKLACVAKYDTDGDGEVSIAEAEAATSFEGLFTNQKSITSFDEIKYFKNVHSLSGVFGGCDKIISITIPNNITDLGTYAFAGCSCLESVILPTGVSRIGNYTFGGCWKLASIDIPSSVTSIGDYAFEGCSLSTIDLPSGLESIGEGAFYDCYDLSEISIPDAVTSLGAYAFTRCFSLASVNLPSGITSVPSYCFWLCGSLVSARIPEGITSVGSYAFAGPPIWKLEFPTSVISLGSNCFSNIACVILPSNNAVSISSNTFSGVSGVFVPSNMIDMYKGITNWSNYSSKIHPLTSYKDKSAFTLQTNGAVDMGTSVKWAAFNVGATKPEEYGDYYAWGETETKSDYSWSTYKYCNGSRTTMTKYCTSSSYGTVDKKTVLEADDDVAHVKWGEKWRMPTDSEWTELRESCYWEWTTYEGIDGYMVYGLGGSNMVFFPAAGGRIGTNLYFVGFDGHYWSSFLPSDYSFSAWQMSFQSTGEYYNRCNGGSVRPVSE